MASIKELDDRLAAARKDYAAAVNMKTQPELRALEKGIKQLMKDLAAVIVGKDILPCPRCARIPHGHEHEATLRQKTVAVYEIGCLVCRHHCAEGLTVEQARDNWNQGARIYGDVQDGPLPVIPSCWINPDERKREGLGTQVVMEPPEPIRVVDEEA